MRNSAMVVLMLLLAFPICAVAQLPSDSDCNKLLERAGKLITIFQNTKAKWQDKKGWQEAPDLAVQLDGCRTTAILQGDLTMLNLYAQDQVWLLMGAYETLRSATNDLGDYAKKVADDYNELVPIVQKCSQSRQHTPPPPIPPPPITCNSFRLGNSVTTTCQ